MNILNPAEVANAVTVKRKQRELSQQALASAAGLSTWTVGNIEATGIAKVSTLIKVFDVLGLEWGYMPAKKRKSA